MVPLVQLSLALSAPEWGLGKHKVHADSWIVMNLAFPISTNLMSWLPSGESSLDNCKLVLQDIALNQSLKAEHTYQFEF